METKVWLPKADYEKKKQIWEEQRKEKERQNKIRDDAYSYLRNDIIPILRKYASEDPYYNEVLGCATQIAREKPGFLRALEKQ